MLILSHQTTASTAAINTADSTADSIAAGGTDGTTADSITGSTATITAVDDSGSKQPLAPPPTLKELADLKFQWAISKLNEHNSLVAKAKSGSSMTKSITESPSSSKPQLVEDEYIKSGFYADLGFTPRNLELVEKVASLIVSLSKSNRVDVFSVDTFWPNIESILMLYTELGGNRMESRYDPPSIEQAHHILIENLAQNIYEIGVYNLVYDLERVCINWDTYQSHTGKIAEEGHTFPGPMEPILIESENMIKYLRGCQIINYIHPLNTALYLEGLNYLYDPEEDLFVVIRHNNISSSCPEISETPEVPGASEASKVPEISETPETPKVPGASKVPKEICSVAKFTFASAVMLRHSPKGPCNVLASDEDFKTFQKVVRSYRSSKGIPELKQCKAMAITTFDEYSKLRKEKQDKRRQKAEAVEGQILFVITSSKWLLGAPLYLTAIAAVIHFSIANLVYLIPFNILAVGLGVSLWFLFNDKELNAHMTSTRSRPIIWVFFILAISGLGVILGLNGASYYASNDRTLLQAIVLGGQCVVLLITMVSIATRWVFTYSMPLATRYVYWVLYGLSILLAASVPLLSIFSLTTYAQVLLNSNVLTISAILLVIGALTNVFDRQTVYSNEEREKEVSINHVFYKLIALVCIFTVLCGLIGLTIWSTSYYNLLDKALNANNP
ncbi:hypothetical protein NEHOM01_0320 [Nematocida homosporus]|uniref:uncharacterized protein n=1 Tax=Nematocida homosporus TaxID=1912981 RepID=UPI0022208D27|nr:uncharacterized protein NEHOM01_0320 [Nematocida homosporus]KAI5184718.1 hypothetical protein NEHOM01_0320 [Nematocida homosporus]